MNPNGSKYVYLFELDSVRTSDKEILEGQKALYYEIVVNGNTVVLTYNQIVESRAFFSLLTDKEYYNSLISLFKKGYICISQYGDIRTLAQYLINTFEEDKPFIYSGWPLKSTQRRLLAMVKRSLVYCDLSELDSFISDPDRAEEMKDIFMEYENGKEKVSMYSHDQMIAILQKLYWLLKLVFNLSPRHEIYLSPKNTEEYQYYKMHDFLQVVVEHIEPNPYFPYMETAKKYISKLDNYKNKSDSRSAYVSEMINPETKPPEGEFDDECRRLAEAIIHLCYNYTCEASICNVSKHYNIREILDPDNLETFQEDFYARLKEYWEIDNPEDRFLQDETSEFQEYMIKDEEFPDFSKAVRIINYINNKKETLLDKCSPVKRYESGLDSQKKIFKQKIYKMIMKKGFFALIAIFFAFGIACGLDFLQTLAEDHVMLSSFILLIIFMVIAEVVTWAITKIPGIGKSLQPLSDSFVSIRHLASDIIAVRKKYTCNHHNKCEQNIDETEPFSFGKPIYIIKSYALRRYEKFAEDNQQFFNRSSLIPIVESFDDETVQQLNRIEEVEGKQFGIVYESRFNRMCVDPVISNSKDNKAGFYPYERVIPINENGVVVIPKCQDRFILLKQFRHAPRKEQLCFPRGFGESGVSAADNALKELYEELGVTINKDSLRYIGSVSPDSGLTQTQAKVFVADIGSYHIREGYEGIREVVSLTEDELKFNMSSNIKGDTDFFDDGYTLAAYSLWSNAATLCKTVVALPN